MPEMSGTVTAMADKEGAGEGTPGIGTPVVSPAPISPTLEISAPMPPSELPVTGQSTDLPGSWLAVGSLATLIFGLLATLVGASLAALRRMQIKRWFW
jgi:hypothetical protein